MVSSRRGFAGMEKWQKYDEKWRNRPVHDYWERVVERKPPPAPPAWLRGIASRSRRPG